MNEHIENTSTIPKLDLDYFDEIIQNARITTIKQIFFNRAFRSVYKELHADRETGC